MAIERPSIMAFLYCIWIQVQFSSSLCVRTFALMRESLSDLQTSQQGWWRPCTVVTIVQILQKCWGMLCFKKEHPCDHCAPPQCPFVGRRSECAALLLHHLLYKAFYSSCLQSSLFTEGDTTTSEAATCSSVHSVPLPSKKGLESSRSPCTNKSTLSGVYENKHTSSLGLSWSSRLRRPVLRLWALIREEDKESRLWRSPPLAPF